MGKNDGYVSPYLLRPLCSYEEVMHEQAERTRWEDRSKRTAALEPRDPAEVATNDVQPRR